MRQENHLWTLFQKAGRACTLIGALIVLAAGPRTYAQVLYGSIVGHVVDASGAAIPQAAVTITNKETGQSRAGTTNESGDFAFLDVQTGTYSIKASITGFKAYERTTVVVSLNTTTRLDVAMEVGAMTENVTVTAEAAVLQTDTSEVHADVTAQQLANLPVPLGRNYQQIYRALPGFSPPSNSHSIPTNPSRSLEFNVNGTSDNQNNTRIDGVSTYNIQLPHVTAYVPTLDSIEEVNVVTNSFDAEQGFAGGAAINVQTKSGTNQIHGSLFEYNSNSHTKAWPMQFDNAGANVGTKPKAIYNQYGGSVGGPIIKDKLFYFVSFEGTGDHRSVERRVTIPTTEARTGDLSALSSALETDIYDPMTGDPVTGEGRSQFIAYPTGYIDPAMVNAACTDAAGCLNMIPTSRLDPSAQKILALLPGVNQAGRDYKTNNYYVAAPFIFDRHQVDTKVNYNPTSKFTLIGTFGKLNYKTITPTVFGASLVGRPIGGTSNPGKGDGGTYRFTIMGTYTFSPNFLMDAHFGYAKQTTSSVQPGLGTNTGTDTLGIPGTNGTRDFESGWPEFDVGGFATMGVDVNFMPYYRKDPQSQYVANFNWIKGKHNIRFGTDYYRMGLNHTQPEFLSGNAYGPQGGFDFSEGFTQNTIAGERTDSSRANSLASFLLGLPDVASRTYQVPDVMRIRANLLSAYLRDRWNVTPKLTLDYGVRWEYIPVPTRDNRGIERYDPLTNTELVCGVGSVPKDCGITVSTRMFAPRIGFAYRASNTFVVRAGYGITFDPYMALEPLRGNYPTMVALVDNTEDVIPIRRLSDGTPSFSGAGSLPVGIGSIPTPSEGDGVLPMPSNYDFLGYPQNMHRGYVESWNFTLQKELGRGFTAQAGYVATRSIRQLAFLDSNAGQVLGAGDAGRPLFTQYGRTGYTGFITPVGTGHYDSLQAQLQRRFNQGFSFTLNYTWSKAINAVDNSDWSPAIQAIPYLGLNRAPTSFDRTHNLQFMTTWQLPFGTGKQFLSGQGRVVNAIVSGWQTNSLISLMSGAPFTVYASGNLNMPGNTQTADQVKPNVTQLGGTGTGTPFYDPTAYADVNSARFGTSGFNSLRGPGIVNWDFGVTREFRITERWKLQFRMESFNFTNTPHFDLPDSCPCDGSDFMTITGTTNLAREGIDERQFRFGLRLIF
jgi:Carboxypeptidase regulatory-like domain/TonB dependent receptor-like, beta-barrel/TonB-dependent Receptor Plug Domain